jgi:hypothetical protein
MTVGTREVRGRLPDRWWWWAAGETAGGDGTARWGGRGGRLGGVGGGGDGPAMAGSQASGPVAVKSWAAGVPPEPEETGRRQGASNKRG